MKQQLIIETDASVFHRRVTELMDDDWLLVPSTLIANLSGSGASFKERFVCLMFKDDEEDTCQCGECGGAHHGHMPPPFFQSPDFEPPTDPDCNPGAHGGN